jgi:hypothetical protein
MVKGFLLATEGYDWRTEGEPHTRYSPDKINVNPDFIKSNYLTAS